MRKVFPFSSAAALILIALAPEVFAQNSALGKTLSFIPNDEAWGDVVEKTQPCSVPGEASCSQFNIEDKSLTPLQSFSNRSDASAIPNQNNPAEVSNALTPALTSLMKGKATALEVSKNSPRRTLKNPPPIRGGNGTFITLPFGVQRINQTTKKTLHSLSKDNGQ